jgi:hypothetical protein
MAGDPDFRIAKPVKPFTFMHYRLGRGKVTCAIRWSPQDPQLVEVGMSFCSPKDIFNKKKGRQIATARVLKGRGQTFSFYPDPEKRVKEQVYEKITLYSQTRKSHRTQAIFSGWDLPGWAFRG